MRWLKTALAVLGVVLALAGVASVTAGGFTLGLYRHPSASSGFFTTAEQTVGSDGFALTVPDINEQLAGRWQRWLLSKAGATVRVTGTSRLPAPIFLGVASTAQVSKYLSGVPRDRITGIDLAGGSVQYESVSGGARPSIPEEQPFWLAEVSGTGSRTLEWTLREGDWAVVIMNGDASAPVAADVRLGARFGIMFPLMAGLLGGGVALLAVGATLIVVGRRGRSGPGRRSL
jgi:hypothetical protein